MRQKIVFVSNLDFLCRNTGGKKENKIHCIVINERGLKSNKFKTSDEALNLLFDHANIFFSYI